jgi:hypothetical protein
MKFEDAVKKSIKSFLAGKAPKETAGVMGGDMFFTPDYFDELELELLAEKKPKKGKKKAKEMVDEV